MHMPAGRLISHRKTERYDKKTQMIWSRQYVAIAARCLEVTFSLTGEEEAERIEGGGGVQIPWAPVGPVKAHISRSHGICVPQMRGVNDLGLGLATYMLYFPSVSQEVKFLLPG